MTIFLGCGFAAKYLEGGGNFSVPLQWLLGLRRLKLDAIWLELLPATNDLQADEARIKNFQRQLRTHGLAGRYSLLYQKPAADTQDLDAMRCIGISKHELLERIAGPNVLLNLAYSVHPPLLLKFERRIFCDLDPSEIFYWMTKMEMGQSYHHEFWTIGLNVHGSDCQLPNSSLNWKTFYPLVDTKLFRLQPKPFAPKFTTVGQWYWGGAVEVAGEFPDLSKKLAFDPYLDLPTRVPEAQFELAMNIRRYLASALAEFTAIKGVDVAWRTGWISDRAAAFLALGRPVITEDTSAGRYLPAKSGFSFVRSVGDAESAVKEVLCDWAQLSRQARDCAAEVFDSKKNLKAILGL